MTVIVQAITTRWGKASRGAPGAVSRAAVPESVSLSVVDAGVGVTLHEMEASEVHSFEVDDRGIRALGALPVEVAGLHLEEISGRLQVTRLGDTSVRAGWPPRSHDVSAFVLDTGQWGRTIRNSRLSGYQGWSYSKTVVNVAYQPRPSEPVFVVSTPDFVLDEQEHLW